MNACELSICAQLCQHGGQQTTLNVSFRKAVHLLCDRGSHWPHVLLVEESDWPFSPWGPHVLGSGIIHATVHRMLVEQTDWPSSPWVPHVLSSGIIHATMCRVLKCVLGIEPRSCVYKAASPPLRP